MGLFRVFRCDDAKEKKKNDDKLCAFFTVDFALQPKLPSIRLGQAYLVLSNIAVPELHNYCLVDAVLHQHSTASLTPLTRSLKL